MLFTETNLKMYTKEGEKSLKMGFFYKQQEKIKWTDLFRISLAQNIHP